jgi:hypothetical protein
MPRVRQRTRLLPRYSRVSRELRRAPIGFFSIACLDREDARERNYANTAEGRALGCRNRSLVPYTRIDTGRLVFCSHVGSCSAKGLMGWPCALWGIHDAAPHPIFRMASPLMSWLLLDAFFSPFYLIFSSVFPPPTPTPRPHMISLASRVLSSGCCRCRRPSSRRRRQ